VQPICAVGRPRVQLSSSLILSLLYTCINSN